MAEAIYNLTSEALAQTFRKHDTLRFLFGDQASMELTPDLRPYPAYNFRVVRQIEDIIQAKPDSDSSPGPNDRLMPGSSWWRKSLRLFAGDVAEGESPSETQPSELARVDYVKMGRRVLWIANDELELPAGLYTQAQNFVVDSNGDAHHEKALAHGLRFNEKNVVLRGQVPASLAEMKGLLRILEVSEQEGKKVPVMQTNLF